MMYQAVTKTTTEDPLTKAAITHISDEVRDALAEGLSLSTAVQIIATDLRRSEAFVREGLRQYKKNGGSNVLVRGHIKPTDNAYDIARKVKNNPKGKFTDLEREIALSVRLANIFEVSCIYHSSFSRKSSWIKLMGPMPEDAPLKNSAPRDLKALPAFIASLYKVPVFTREQEQHIFRKFNFIKWQITKERKALDPENPDLKLLKRLEAKLDHAQELKSEILKRNLRLLVSLVKNRQIMTPPNQDFFETISDLNLELSKIADRFNFNFGCKFSTYATWGLKNNSIRLSQRAYRDAERFITGSNELLQNNADQADEIDDSSKATAINRTIGHLLGTLKERQREVLIHRFGLMDNSELTLKEVGKIFRLTRERIRQIETAALENLRDPDLLRHIQRSLDHTNGSDSAKPAEDSIEQLADKFSRLRPLKKALLTGILYAGSSTAAELKITLSNIADEKKIESVLTALLKDGFLGISARPNGIFVYCLSPAAKEVLNRIERRAS